MRMPTANVVVHEMEDTKKLDSVAEDSETVLKAGATVQITGLETTVDLNGLMGECGDWEEAVGRYQVHLQNGEHVKVKPEN